MAKFDHHLHTITHSPDSVITPEALIRQARSAGLDGVVITDHDYQWKADELDALARQASVENLKVFSGAEISAREGHFLVYGLPNLDDVPAGVLLKDLLRTVKAHGAAIVAAHPFRWDQDFQAIVDEHGPVFDALEMVSNNVTPETRSKTERLLSRYEMGRTGSSDGHEPGVIGCYYSEFPGTIETLGDFVAALHARSVRPGHNARGRLMCGPVVP